MYAWIIYRDNKTARVSFQFHHTVIAAAAAAHHEKECDAGPKIEDEAKTEGCCYCRCWCWCCLSLLLKRMLPLAAASCAAACCGGIAAAALRWDSCGGTAVNSATAAVAWLPFVGTCTWYAVFLLSSFVLASFFSGLVAAHPHFPHQFRRRRLQNLFNSDANTRKL